MAKTKQKPISREVNQTGRFRIEFLNASQELAWNLYQQHEVLFLLGPAGTAKTHLAMAFAIHDVLNHKQTSREKIILARPVVEAGENLGFLPGMLEDKVGPYMEPLVDCMNMLIPEGSPQRDMVAASVLYKPLAYLRGKTFNKSVAILDEAQNATWKQIVMFLTRKGRTKPDAKTSNCKLIITGDPDQSDIHGPVALLDIAEQLETVEGTAVIRFNEDSIVRDDWVKRALKKIKDPRK